MWPPNEEGKELLDVVLDCSVDSAFLMLYGGLTELRVGAAEATSLAAAAALALPPALQLAGLSPACLPPPLPTWPFLDLQKAFNEIASNKEYSTTAWMDSAEAVQAAAVGPTPPPLRDTAGLKAGMLRRASYSGTMMGSKVGHGGWAKHLQLSRAAALRRH